jgi:hypothetical protein
MKIGLGSKLRIVLIAPVTAAVLAGCASNTTPVVGGPAATVASSGSGGMVTYPEGRYQIYGDGTATNPYYWVWVPTGVAAAPSPPVPVPVVPRTVIAATAPERVVAYQQGQYKLYGDGTTPNPYYWVWVPAGTNAPPPPPLPQANWPAPAVATSASGRMVTYPEGRYQIYGDGTATNPYYWVWVPTGVAAAPSPPVPVPVVPRTVIAATAPERVVAYQQGQYKLYGDGTTPNPYYWVWVPAGTNAPPPPPFPQAK